MSYLFSDSVESYSENGNPFKNCVVSRMNTIVEIHHLSFRSVKAALTLPFQMIEFVYILYTHFSAMD